MGVVRSPEAALIAIGGMAGAAARYGLNGISPGGVRDFPWTTLTINVAGSLLLGLIVAFAPRVARWWVGPLLGVGFCGAFTTFSAFSLQTVQLVRHQEPMFAAGYIALTLVAGLGAARLGSRA